MTQPGITKDQFLANLEKALSKLILNGLYDNADKNIKQKLGVAVSGFIRENAAEYTLEELKETFVSAETTIGLFFEYQEAKSLVKATRAPTAASTVMETIHDGCSHCGSAEGGPVFPSGTWTERHTGIEFVWVHGSEFQMGSGDWDDQGLADEKPVHQVWLDGFWISKFPITVAQYALFASEVPDHRPAWQEQDGVYNIDTGKDPLYKSLGSTITSAPYPIVGVSWHDATAFAGWVSKKNGLFFQLPTEAQWEYAARSGGREEKYAGGSDVDRVAWYDANSKGTAHPVGEKMPNGLGIYDMCGNVSEWCQDRYHKHGYGDHRPYNPVNRETGSCHVVRGGSYNYGARDVRCADRGLFVPEHRDCALGFRIVRAA